MRSDEWRELKALRIEALADTPIGFLETHAQAIARSDEDWQERARRNSAGREVAMFAAIDHDGHWVGMTGVLDVAGDDPLIIAVYVQPQHRGRDAGVARDLIESGRAWAAGELAASRVRLEVHEDNLRARRFYERMGFSYTGVSQRYPLDETREELEMARSLEDLA